MRMMAKFQFQGICDGAASVLLASEEAVKENGLKPLARLVAYSAVGVPPEIMGIGPVPAIQNVLKVAGLTLNDIDLFEVRIHNFKKQHKKKFQQKNCFFSESFNFLRFCNQFFPKYPMRRLTKHSVCKLWLVPSRLAWISAN